MNDPAGSRLSISTLLILLGIFIARGIILACILPPFEGWDEFQHVGYIDHCAHYTRPAVYQQTQLDRDFVRAVAAFPQPKDALTQPIGAVGYQEFWSSARRPPPVTGSTGFYQSQHPFLYYRLMSPIYQLCGGRKNLRLAVSVLRLINLGFGAIGLWLVLTWIRQSLRGSAALLSACCVTFHPLMLLDMVRVASDGLAFALGTAVVVLCLRLHMRWSRNQALLLAGVLPFAILAKATNLVLLPLVLLSYLLLMKKNGRGQSISMIATVVFFLVITAPYFTFNLRHFAVLTPMQEAVANHVAGRSLLMIIQRPPLILWPVWTWCLWIHNALWVGGWSFLQVPRFITACYEITIAIGLIATGSQLISRKLPIQNSSLVLILLLLVFSQAGLMYHAAEAYSAWSGQVTTNPWYAAVAIPWWMILICLCLSIRSLGLAVAVSLLAIEFIAEIYGTVFRMIPFYYHAATVRQFAERMSSLHPIGLGFWMLIASTFVLISLMVLLPINRRFAV